MPYDLDQIIRTGDRADFKAWLATCSDKELQDNWIKFVSCTVQDFPQLVLTELRKRNIVR